MSLIPITIEALNESMLTCLLKRVEDLEAEAAKNDERIAFLEDELEARVKLAEQFHTAKS